MLVIWILLTFLPLYIVIIIRGPTLWDRFLGLCLISTKIEIIIIVLASVYNNTQLLDFAIIYTLLWFMCVIFTALFFLDRIKGGKSTWK